MIGKLKGKLVEVDGNAGLIETAGGVFYRVFLTPSIISNYKLLTTSYEIYTYLQVRDDAMVLYGFETKKEHDFFVLLLTVPGVGPKTAFNIISFTKPEEVVVAVTSNNIEYFTKIPGLGKKTAMKIVLELSQKLKSEFNLEKMYLSKDDKTVIDALVSLGFTSSHAKELLTKIPKDLSIEDKIKKALTKANV